MSKVEVAAVCTVSQPPEYWTQIVGKLLKEQSSGIEFSAIRAVRSAMPDHGKNKAIGKDRANRTDANRNIVSKGFLAGDADWLLWIDEDTVPPDMFVTKLLKLHKPFVGGLYFTPKENHKFGNHELKQVVPLMYKRMENGLYNTFEDYPKGALIPIDAIGMGCTLIHRSVFEDIMDQHVVFQRPNGSLFPVHKSKIKDDELSTGEGYVENGVYHMPVTKPSETDDRDWPFFAMEYGRTEDLQFCELAIASGIQPYIDTTIVCDHLKTLPVNENMWAIWRDYAGS
ncbi:MAG: hypothetical protein DRJ03_16510 [Chloroflexi bacterium]|nr:MAG: hypothetical protein DRJ03_16510 [Chloroflexota bacterium]